MVPMNLQKRFILSIMVIFLALVLFACTDDAASDKQENGKSSSDHIWKQQIDVLQNAKDAAKKMQDSLNQHQQKLDESN